MKHSFAFVWSIWKKEIWGNSCSN